MSRHQLQLYQASYQYAKEIYRIKLKLPKSLKYDLGQESFSSSLNVVKCVALASRSKDKGRLILRLLAEAEAEWVFLRLLYDLRGISEGEFKVLSERLSEIEKQAQAWLKWCQKEKRLVSVANPNK